MVLDSILTSATAAPVNGVQATVAPPGSLTLQPDAKPEIASIVYTGRVNGGRAQISTPSGHDTTTAYTVAGAAVNFPYGRVWTRFLPPVSAGETVGVTFYGAGITGAVDLLALNIVYRSIQGADWVDPDGLEGKIESVTAAHGSLTPTADGTWPQGTALSTLHSNLRPQRRYAILGVEAGFVSTVFGLMVVGPDTGWYRQLWPVGGQDRGTMSAGDNIVRIASETGLGVPVIMGGNATQTLLGYVGTDGSGTRTATIYLGLLK